MTGRRPSRRTLAGRLLTALSHLVPRAERREWLDEWRSELEVLETDDTQRRSAYPGPLRFVMGALPHALWMRKEEWTMDSALQDLRYAARVLRRAPAFTIVATLTLALGIGANATIYTLINGLLVQDPPGVHEPDRLVQLARSYDEAPRWDNWSWPAMEAIRREAQGLAGVAGYADRSLTLGTGTDAEQVAAQYVTGNYFEVLGVRPALGRLLGPADDVTPGAHPVVVLGFDLWQRRYGGDPEVLGRTVDLAGGRYDVVGVAPARFAGVETLGQTPEVFVPGTMTPSFRGMSPFDEWGWSWIDVVARLGDGVGPEAARSAMATMTERLREQGSYGDDVRILLAEGVGMAPDERAEARRLSLLLSGVALLVLLLTCANVANLFVARATTRQGEMSVRLALGAGRARLTRQLVTESLVLGLAAAVVALLPLAAGARALPALFPYSVRVPLEPDAAVLASLVGLGLLSGLLFGAVPALTATRRGVASTLRAVGSRTATPSARLRDGLVVLQLALSLGLLAGAALLTSSLANASRADPGFESEGLLATYVDLEGTGRYDDEATVAFGELLARDAAELPGVVSATLASQAPFVGGFARSSRSPAERPNDPAATVEAEAVFVTAHYLETLGIPLSAGRALRTSAEEPERVALVNEALARRFWPGEDAVGKYLHEGEPIRVVGVVGDVQFRSLRASPMPTVYQPLNESFTQRLVLIVRTRGAPLDLAPAVRRLVADLDPGLPVLTSADVHARMAGSLGTTRTVGTLVGVFAALALVLSVVGLYGLMSFAVAQRVREMGIRMALGAGPGRLVRLVLVRALGLTAAGLVFGLGLALAVGRGLDGYLYGVGTADPAALAAAAALLLASATLAAWLPARRAGRVDAAVSLREE